MNTRPDDAARKAAASAKASTKPAPTEPAPTEPALAENGTAAQAAQGAAAPVVIGGEGGPVEPGGPGAGAARTAQERQGFAWRPLDEGAAAEMALRGPLTEDERRELGRLRRERAAGFVVDARDVPGRRLARAATAIRRDGVLYAPDGPNPFVPVDFEAHTELRQIGAVTDTPWGELQDELREA